MYLYLFLIIIFFASETYSQPRPTLQVSAGLTFPGEDLSGDLVYTDFLGNISISSDFIKNNYAASTGVSITGTLKFPIEQTGSLNGNIIGSYAYFNAFRKSSFGTALENNIVIPATLDNRISISTFAFGIDASPFSESSVTPFVNANLSFNILSLSLSRNDLASVIFNDAFRMGLITNAGISLKINNEYSFVLSGSYNMSNLFLKSHNDSYADRIEYYSDNNAINDEAGNFYSNLSDPDFLPVIVQGNTKNVNWLSINLGLSIVLGKSNKK